MEMHTTISVITYSYFSILSFPLVFEGVIGDLLLKDVGPLFRRFSRKDLVFWNKKIHPDRAEKNPKCINTHCTDMPWLNVKIDFNMSLLCSDVFYTYGVHLKVVFSSFCCVFLLWCRNFLVRWSPSVFSRVVDRHTTHINLSICVSKGLFALWITSSPS